LIFAFFVENNIVFFGGFAIQALSSFTLIAHHRIQRYTVAKNAMVFLGDALSCALPNFKFFDDSDFISFAYFA